MRPTIYAFCFLIVFSISCSSGEKELPYKDLLTYGIPLEIQAPDSVDIRSSDIGGQKDVVLNGEDGYKLQIFSSDAYHNESTAVEEYKSEISKHPRFKEFVQEKPQGFVYAFQLDSTTVNYGFRYIDVKGGKEIVIQQGMLGIYTKEEAEKLFNYALKSK